MDLKRAAQWYYLNPQGKAHWIFLNHACKILANFSSYKERKILRQVLKIKKELSNRKDRDINLADKILTLGFFLKR